MPTDDPRFGCEACGALAVQVPEWSHDESLITCGGCGATLAAIRELRERLIAALEEYEDQPAKRSERDRAQEP
jgi:transcription elongation factor Elf1